MSDDEERSEEESPAQEDAPDAVEDVAEEEEVAPAQEEGPSEAELAMQRRRAPVSNVDDEESAELLETNRKERVAMEQEIQELRERSERRKKERFEEEKRRAAAQEEEEQRRRDDEDERKRKRQEEEETRRDETQKKLAEFQKYSNNASPNFIITKRAGADESKEEGEEGAPKKSKEQLEAEKKAILEQRIIKLDTSGFTGAQWAEKAKEIHHLIHRAESEKYDLEKQFKEQQMDMIELAEKARNANTDKKSAGKLQRAAPEENDKIQEKFSSAPLKVLMYSKFERQQDKRSYSEKSVVFTGPVYAPPAVIIKPIRNVVFAEGTGLPSYVDIPGAEPRDEE